MEKKNGKHIILGANVQNLECGMKIVRRDL